MPLSNRGLLTEAERLVAAVESDELGLEHGVAVDLETSALVALDSTEAGRVGLVNGGESDLVSGNLGHVCVTDGNRHVGQSGATGVDETTNLSVKLCTLDLRVVCFGDGLVNEEKRGTGISDGLGSTGVLDDLVANGKLGRGELPEARRGVHGNPSHLALELGGIDLAELVNTSAIRIQVSGEHREVEVAHNIVEEGLLGGLLGTVIDSVEGREGKADKTVSVGVLNKGSGYSIGKFNSLVLDSHATNGDCVGSNSSSGTGSITVGDLPLSTGHLLERGRLGRVVNTMASCGLGRKIGAEDPPRKH